MSEKTEDTMERIYNFQLLNEYAYDLVNKKEDE